MSNRSYKIWLLEVCDPDGAQSVRAYTLRKVAERDRRRLQRELDEKWGKIIGSGPNRIQSAELKQIDLVTHDGAHVLHADLQKAVGQKGRA